eukprot:8411670-Ditylum_brightwellii.AAC.1
METILNSTIQMVTECEDCQYITTKDRTGKKLPFFNYFLKSWLQDHAMNEDAVIFPEMKAYLKNNFSTELYQDHTAFYGWLNTIEYPMTCDQF